MTDFASYLLVDEGKAAITVEKMTRRLRGMEADGFQLAVFKEGPAEAKAEGRRYLATRRRNGASVFAFNEDVKTLNGLSRLLEYDVRFRKMKEPRSVPKALEPDEDAALLAYRGAEDVPAKMRRALYSVARVTGARRSEIARLDDTDLDAERKRVHIRFPAKGGLKRWIPVPAWLFSPKRPLAAWLRVRPVPPRDSHALWTTTERGRARDGPPRRCSLKFLGKALRLLGKTQGVRVNFTITRHTRATELLRAGFRESYVQFYLGHADLSSTRIYLDVRPEDVERELARRPAPDPYGRRVKG